VGETHGHLYFPPADFAGTVFPYTGILRCHGKNRGAMAFVLAQDRPSHANQFVGQGHDDHILMGAPQQLLEPMVQTVRLLVSLLHDAACPLNEQGSQVFIAPFTDAQ
jgi:hypothetical protein